jgi:heptosyltransferase I
MTAPSKLLIIRLSSLGDILHVAPACAALRGDFPEAEIHWLAAKKNEFLVRAIRGIDKVHSIDTNAVARTPFRLSAWSELWRALRQLQSEHFDIAIDFQGLLKTAIIGALSGSRSRLGFAKEIVRERPSDWFYHRKLPPPESRFILLN